MIADLHCDLLLYLNGGHERSAYDLDVRCAIPQLKQGGVWLQTMAAYSETRPDSSKAGLSQALIFSKLAKTYPDTFRIIRSPDDLIQDQKIGALLALENASAFCDEEESLEEGFNNLSRIRKLCGHVVYISLTWNTENRFGGGAHSSIGLKSDGMRLLDYLHEKRIAVDLSHSSDPLAHDIFNYVDKKSLKIPIIASHSNFRDITNVPRNLPKDIAKEIINRKGIIGLNFIRSFVGEADPINFVRHLEYGLSLGGEENLCFGADFYYLDDIPVAYRKPPDASFFPNFANSSTYNNVIELWQKNLGINADQLEKIRYQNIVNYLTGAL